MVSSIGTDGSVGNQDSENSLLSQIGKTITPAFAPMGIKEDNWQATVGIFTGIFAKEVVVGTLDALYSPGGEAETMTLAEQVSEAFASVPANLADLGGALADPLGIGIDEYESVEGAATENEVATGTIARLQSSFDGQLGAFSYLLFVLLYMPCVATIGVIVKEIGRFWAIFSTVWSVVLAYTAATLCYQLGSLSTDPTGALITSSVALLVAGGMFALLVFYGRRQTLNLIPLVNLES
jgi:ferrous iron transport protein B